MEIDFISDIHLDFYLNVAAEGKIRKFIESILPKEKSKILIIAGDIGHNNGQNKVFLKILKEYYEYIFLTYGNHDLYLLSKNTQKKFEWDSFKRIEDLKNICEELNIYFMDGNVIEVEGITIGGLPGWYEMEISDLGYWKQTMNDSVNIYTTYPICLPYSSEKYRGFCPVTFWEKQKELLGKMPKVDILFSHIAMYEMKDKHMNSKYIGDPDNMFYFRTKGGYELIENKTKNYIFGHTHNVYSYEDENIYFACNPLGYPGDLNTSIKTFKIK